MANVQGLRDYVGACLYHSAYTFNSIPCFFLISFVCLGFISFFCNKLIINMKKLNLFLLVLFICNCPVVSGYAFFDRDIRLLTMQDGLADNTITSIYKDRDGFMWFGTNNGLSRYDGKLIKNFSSSPAYMYVSEIVEMSDRYLGVIAGNTLYCFARSLEKFIPIVHATDYSSVHVSHLLPIDNNSFWGLSGNKLYLYTQEEVKNEKGEVVQIKLKCE